MQGDILIEITQADHYTWVPSQDSVYSKHPIHCSSTIVGVASERMLRNERSRGNDSSRNLDFVHTERIITIPTGTDGTPLPEGPSGRPSGAGGVRDHVTHQTPPPAGSRRDVKTLTDQGSDKRGSSSATPASMAVEPAEDAVEVSLPCMKCGHPSMWGGLKVVTLHSFVDNLTP